MTTTAQGAARVAAANAQAQSGQVGGAVTAGGNIVGAGGASLGSAAPQDAPGYVPGSSPTDKISTAANGGVAGGPITQMSQDMSKALAPKPPTPDPNAQLDPNSPAPQNLVDQVAQATAQVNSLVQAKNLSNTSTSTPDLKAQATQIKGTLDKSGVPSPQNLGTANTALSQVGQSLGNNTTPQSVTDFMNPATNPAVADAMKQLYDIVSPPAERDMLKTHMDQLATDRSELMGLKTELMNTKRVMSGTESELRDEITKANGFATESQIQALTIARNKTLVQKSALLSDQIQAQTDLVNSDVSLVGDDKQTAAQQFSQRMSSLNYLQENTKYQLSAAKDTYKTLIDKNPDTLYRNLLNDPAQAQRFESVMGISMNDLAGMKSGNYEVVKGGTDAFGNPLADKVFNKNTGQFVSGGSASGMNPTNTPNVNTGGAVPIVGSGNIGVGPNKLSFDQYGLLANTNFDPKNMVDQLSQKYLDQYIKNGTVPTASSLGRNMKPEAMAQVDSRARELYFKATGTPLPNPEVIKANQGILANNLKLSNNLRVQEQTVSSNVDFSLANMKKNDLNSVGFKPLDNAINTVNDMFNDPATGQLIAQNSTIQNELGSLLAVKNASGTTVYDKLSSAGLISKNDSPEAVKTKVTALLTEAANFADSLRNANADLYKQVDPLMQDPNNPMRDHVKVESALNKTGANYSDVVGKTPAGMIPVMDKDGNVGYIKPSEFNSNYTKL